MKWRSGKVLVGAWSPTNCPALTFTAQGSKNSPPEVSLLPEQLVPCILGAKACKPVVLGSYLEGAISKFEGRRITMLNVAWSTYKINIVFH